MVIGYIKENGGAGSARNYALERMSGDYVMFIDSDDLVKEDYVEKMVGAARKTSPQLVICNYMHGNSYSLTDFYEYKTTQNPSYTVVELSEYRWTGKYTHSISWRAIYARVSVVGKGKM